MLLINKYVKPSSMNSLTKYYMQLVMELKRTRLNERSVYLELYSIFPINILKPDVRLI